MNVIETSADGLKREFKVLIPAQDIANQVDNRLQELSRTVKLPGFRPGKVPMAVIRQRFGIGVRHEVLEQTVSESVEQTIRERGLRTALQPSVSLGQVVDGADLEYTLKVELLPDIEPCDFATLEFERLVVEVADADVQSVIDHLVEEARPVEPVTEVRPAVTGDLLVVDFVGTLDGQAAEGLTGTDVKLRLGPDLALPAFADNLIGATVGEQRRFTAVIPEGHGNPAVAGKEVLFDVTVKALEERKPQVLDDAFAGRYGFGSVDELRRAVRDQRARNFAQRGRAVLKRQLLDRLAAQHDFPVPAGLVEAEFQAIWDRLKEELKQGGAAQDEMGRPEDLLQAEYRAIAERRVRLGLLLAEVGRRNNLTVTKDEVSRAILAEARRYPGQEREVLDFYKKNPEAADRFRAPLFEEKVVDFIVELAKVTERPVDADELTRLEQEAERTPA